MKKILLLSDTHSFLDSKVLKYAETVDELWHAGDIGDVKVTDSLKKIKPLQAVYGNIDGNELRQEFPKDLIFYCEEIKVFITHIGGYPNKYAPKIVEKLKLHQPKLFICGHTHILKVMYDKPKCFTSQPWSSRKVWHPYQTNHAEIYNRSIRN